jgi:hypothetical protein
LLNAYSQTGRHYKNGGKNPQSGFDDAGFVHWVYAQEGIKVPVEAKNQVANGKAVAKDDLRPGDILVFKTPKAESYLMGIYSGNGNFLLASSKSNHVTETAAFGTEFGPYFLGGRRYIDDPGALPLTDDLRTAAANGAVKLALSELGDNIPKPTNIYGGTTKKSSSKASYKKSRSKKSSKKVTATKKSGKNIKKPKTAKRK